MAIGKNKRISKGKKGGKKKVADPYLRKEWFDLKAPALFNKRKFGKTIVTKTTGTKIATEMLKGRVATISLADLQENPDLAFRKMKLCIEETQGKECLTNFHGMDMTRDSLGWLVRKWQTLIEAHVEVKTLDGYMLRIFCIGFTKKRDNQIKKTCYAQTSQIKLIRKKMMEIMTKEATQNDLKTLVQKFITEEIGKAVVKQTATIFPLKDVSILKVKVLKKPKFDISKLMEIHMDTNVPAAAKAKESKESENTLSQEIKTSAQ